MGKQPADIEKLLERKTIEMKSIQQIGRALSSELKIERLLMLVIEEVNKLMDAERGTFYIVDQEKGELWSKVAQAAEILEIRLKIGVGIAGTVAKKGNVINIPDAYKDKTRFPSGPYCKKGDWIIMRSYSGTRVSIQGKEFRILNDDSVEAVIQDPRGISKL